MSLSTAVLPDGTPLGLKGPGPFPTSSLAPLRGRGFSLTPDDEAFVRGVAAERGYLGLSRAAWDEHPDHMDFLSEDSPIYDLKRLERDLYLVDWEPALASARTVLDVGCGVGRFALWALAQGKAVYGVDADLRSLQRLAWRAVDAGGRLDLSWSSALRLPDVRVDAAIACEVLCYVPEAERAMKAIASRIRPGGALCLSVEARWGWAMAVDVSPGTIGHALVGDGVVEGEDGSWVRTYEADDVQALVEGAGFEIEALIPNHYVLDGPLERAAPETMGLGVLRDLEDAARHHPVWSPLNRIWSVVARRCA